MKDNIFKLGLEIFSKRFPDLSEKLSGVDISRIETASAADGGICYVVKNDSGQFVCVTNPNDPIQSAQKSITTMQDSLTAGLSPAVVVGLAPGYVLDTVYSHFNSRLKFNEPFRHIYVIVDSLICLAAWLGSADRREILLNEAVTFYWHEDVWKIVDLCESDLQRSHLFIPLSSLPEPLVERIIHPLAKLYLKRQSETELWRKANTEYYDSLTDEKLLEIFQGKAGRKPRLMMPTHASSTVAQYSTRDTCAAFERMGWETHILKMSWDISDWRMVKTIHDFKPDLLILINHLRTEDTNFAIYPENMMFITWIQDTMLHLNNRDMADKWNKFALGVHRITGQPRRRDLLIGYTDIIKPFGYAENRMTYLPMIVNTETFHPRQLTAEQQEKYGCDVCFASNKGKTTEEALETELLPYLSTFNISKKTAYEIHDLLWKIYRDKRTITSYAQLEELICSKVPSFNDLYSKIEDKDIKANIIQKIFWTLNDHIYRHIVLEWCDELGIKLNLYGKYWETHPRFKKYAKGVIRHGKELSIAYQAAKHCLHLNAIEGIHQRLSEIIACGATPLTRINFNYVNNVSTDLINGLIWLNQQSFIPDDRKNNPDNIIDINAKHALFKYFFEYSISILEESLIIDPLLTPLKKIAKKMLRTALDSVTEFTLILSSFKDAMFNDKEKLLNILKKLPEYKRDETVVHTNKYLIKNIISELMNHLHSEEHNAELNPPDFLVEIARLAIQFEHIVKTEHISTDDLIQLKSMMKIEWFPVSAYLRLVVALFQHGYFEEAAIAIAIEKLDMAYAEKNDIGCYIEYILKIGNKLLQDGNGNIARALFERVSKLIPADSPGFPPLSSFLLRVRSFDLCLQLMSNPAVKSKTAILSGCVETYALLAICNNTIGETSEWFRQLIEDDKSLLKMKIWRACLLSYQGLHEQAYSMVMPLTDLDKENGVLASAILSFVYCAEGRLDEALAEYNRIIAFYLSHFNENKVPDRIYASIAPVYIALGSLPLARAAAQKGAACTLSTHSKMCENILQCLDADEGLLPRDSSHALSCRNGAMTYYYPWTPLEIWLLLRAAVIYERSGNKTDARRVLRDDLMKHPLVHEESLKKISEILDSEASELFPLQSAELWGMILLGNFGRKSLWHNLIYRDITFPRHRRA